MTQLTLCIIHHPPRVLLGMKKRGFGVGRWNGFGGKVEQGESIEEAAGREVREEAGLEVVDMQEVGSLIFSFESDPERVLEVRVFRITQFSGEPKETEEMRPQWFTEDEIPYDHMWSDDRLWLPMLLQGKRFHGTFHFDRPSDANHAGTILRYSLKEESLSS